VILEQVRHRDSRSSRCGGQCQVRQVGRAGHAWWLQERRTSSRCTTCTTGGSAVTPTVMSSATASLSAIIFWCASSAASSRTGAPRSLMCVSSMPTPKWSPTIYGRR
jgi:hypothetical protein